jgi:hypothetical protein
MRTTLTLDDDVSAMLKRLQAERGISFKEAVNQALRQGLYAAEPPPRPPYTLETFSLGQSLIPLDDIGEALAVAEGEDYR